MPKKRSKTKQGKIRKKRGDTKIGNIEKKHNVDFGVRSDMKLEKYLKKKGFNSLSKALATARKMRDS